MGLLSNGLLLLICILLLAIAWQDFRTRTVYVFLFGLLFIAVCLLQYVRCGFNLESFIHIALNTSVLSIQLLTVYGYLKIVRKINFFDGMGLGDIFFYICAIPILSLPIFILYNISSLFAALMLYITAGKKMQIESTSIPLAGIQALALVVAILVVEGIFAIPVLGTCFLLSF